MYLKIFQYIIAIILPWLSMLIIGENLLAFFMFFLQLTVIGWIPASIWACKLLKNHNNKQPNAATEKNESQQKD